MTPSMDVTIDNIKRLSPASFKKASGYIESLLRIDNVEDSIATVSNEVFLGQADAMFDEYSEAFSVLAK